MITIKESDENKVVKLEVVPVYPNSREKIGKIYFGDRASIIIEIIKYNIIPLLICLALTVIFIINFSLFIIITVKLDEKYMSILYLAIIAYFTRSIIFLRTYIIQLFSNNIVLVDIISNTILMLGVIPFYLYVNEVYGIFKNKYVKYLCTIDVIYIIISTILHVVGIADYYISIVITIILYIILFGILIYCVINKSPIEDEGFDYSKNFVERHMQQVGIGVFIISLIIELVIYFSNINIYRGIVVEIGLLICIICLGIGDFYKYRAFLRKEKEVIKKLAYYDVLTEVGNRTAFKNNIDKIIEKQDNDRLGIIILDINNLKVVNDELGHIVGDRLIYVSAKVIDKTFGSIGKTYRIGGDEFVVIITDQHSFKRYDEVCSRFNKEIREFNLEASEKFKISIAYGMSICEKVTRDNFDKSMHIADSNMYRRKSVMKNSDE